MSYRSDVYIKCTKDAVGSIYAALQANDMLDRTYMSYDDEYFYFNLYNLKWYSSYPEVSAVMEVLDVHESNVGYLRTGEETGDVEEFGNLPYDWHMQVHIDSNTSGPFHTDYYIAQHHPELAI